MNLHQINFMNMADTVISQLNASAAIWSDKKPIAEVVLKIKAQKSELESLAVKQTSAITKGATMTLKAKQAAMVNLAMQVIQKLRPFATVTNNQDLLSRIDYTISDFTHGKQIDALSRCMIVLETGRRYQAEMAGYELGPEELDALEAAINEVTTLSGKRDGIIGLRKTATDSIAALIDQIRHQLELLDDLIPGLVTDPTFVQTYKNNRRIIDR